MEFGNVLIIDFKRSSYSGLLDVIAMNEWSHEGTYLALIGNERLGLMLVKQTLLYESIRDLKRLLKVIKCLFSVQSWNFSG